MQIEIPERSEWSRYGNELWQRIESGAKEPAIQKYLKDNPWILLAHFAHQEGVCFTEYHLGPDERTDFMIVHGRSFPDITMIELKSPQAPLFTSDGKMSKELNEGMTMTLNRMFMVNNEYDHHYNRISNEIDELFRSVRRSYQGVYAKYTKGNFEVPFAKYAKFWGVVVIGRESDLNRDHRFREGVARFLGHIKIHTYDSIINTLREFDA